MSTQIGYTPGLVRPELPAPEWPATAPLEYQWQRVKRAAQKTAHAYQHDPTNWGLALASSALILEYGYLNALREGYGMPALHTSGYDVEAWPISDANHEPLVVLTVQYGVTGDTEYWAVSSETGKFEVLDI